MDTKTLARFTSKVDISQGEDGCHIFQGSHDTNGYGLVSVGGRQKRAHRLMWEHANGRPVPDGLMVRHGCGVRSCVNAKHLLVGSAWDNAQDTKRHGNYSRGDSHWASKLTEADITEAWDMRRRKVPYRDIANHLGISYTAIHYAINGTTWRHLERPNGLPRVVPQPHIPDELVEVARRMRDDERATWRDIEAATGYTRIHLSLRLPRRTGYNPNPVILSPDEADEAVRLRMAGLSWTKMSRHFDNRISRMGLYYAQHDRLQWWREAEERVSGSPM